MKLGGPSIDVSMLVPLLVMAAAFTLFFATLLLVRIRAAIVARKIHALQRAASDAVGQLDAVPGGAAGSAL
jgi:heme exporter protein C